MRGGGGGGLEPIGKSHVIRVDLDLNPLPPLTKFQAGSAHWGGGQFISLECIRTECLMRTRLGGDSIPARGVGLAENDGFQMA